MAAPIPQTPQRPIPGRFFNTPAQSDPPASSIPPPPSFRPATQSQIQSRVPAPSGAGQQPGIMSSVSSGNSGPSASSGATAATASTGMSSVNRQGSTLGSSVLYPSLAPSSTATATAASLPAGLTLIERAAKTINDKLNEDGNYPPLEGYVLQGSSADYDVPASQSWAPFQLVRQYGIPDEIFEQYNHAQVSTGMGLFAEIHHAWVAIDSSLYLWDYTHPAPELLGYEEAPSNITSVRLTRPRAGVFVSTIKYLLVVATAADVHLLGVAQDDPPNGGPPLVSLFNTKMQAPCKGLNVSQIAGSAATGRVFFAGTYDNDVYELKYQQEEKWFASNCSRVNHTGKGFSSIPSINIFGATRSSEHAVQMEVDDSRDSLYTLSSTSTIRVFNMRSQDELVLTVERSLQQILSEVQHKAPAPALLGPGCKIVSINTISSKESQVLPIVATTDTGCRIYFSGHSSYYGNDSSGRITSLMVHHVKFPPPESHVATQPSSAFPGQVLANSSQALKNSRVFSRFPPGYSYFFLRKASTGTNETVFMTAPDSGRIAHPQDATQAHRFPEYGMWYELNGQMQDAGVSSAPFSASDSPTGFGNELAVQFDKPTCEIAVLTNSGIYSFRRRRLVDVFAATIRHGGGDDGLDGEIRNFAHQYGRGETIATALAVACGQASEVSVDSRVLRITDNDVLEFARRTFIEHGGRPERDQNIIPASDTLSIDQVRPSPRHEGLALYIARLLRSVWKANIMIEVKTPTGGVLVQPTVSMDRLQSIQRDLSRLQEFLTANKTFIEGLAGPDALGRVSTKQDEVALQAEHRALNSIVKLISDVIEGIAFVLVLFAPEERVDEIVLMLSDTSRASLRAITFERLFCSSAGKDLAKELVKAIVNRNIAAGSNVDTVTDALRRRCGSFCSADDSIIFKAQEQLKRASDSGASTEVSRGLLNEGLRLLQKVAASLSQEQLLWAVKHFVGMEFFAGAIQLCLTVAQESDRGNKALSWVRDGMPGHDSRALAYESRLRCYSLIHDIVKALDGAQSEADKMIDGQHTPLAKRIREAYDLINNSQDEMFQIDLYDYYVSVGESVRLLEIQSPFVVSYLERKSTEDLASADLLWRYHAHHASFIEAARVQLDLAKGNFALKLEGRIQYLSYAKTNASTKSMPGITDLGRSRQSRQELLRSASDLLELANVQSDLLYRLKNDDRINDDTKARIVHELDDQIMPISDLYNNYADQAGYHDISLLIYRIADHRNPADIKNTWNQLIQTTHEAALNDRHGALPFELVGEKVRQLGARVNLAESIFPVPVLLVLLERYAYEKQRDVIPAQWAPSVLLAVNVPYESVAGALEALWFNQELPFKGRARRVIAADLIFTLDRWCEATSRAGPRHMFGGEEYAAGVLELVEQVSNGHASDQDVRDAAQALSMRIRMLLR